MWLIMYYIVSAESQHLSNVVHNIFKTFLFMYNYCCRKNLFSILQAFRGNSKLYVSGLSWRSKIGQHDAWRFRLRWFN
jgi:hypothetical protein